MTEIILEIIGGIGILIFVGYQVLQRKFEKEAKIEWEKFKKNALD